MIDICKIIHTFLIYFFKIKREPYSQMNKQACGSGSSILYTYYLNFTLLKLDSIKILF